MRLLDLFAGIGGFSLAAHWMGWETVAFVEKEKFCQRVLRKNFGQDIEIHDDIFDFSGKPFCGSIDIITGGFPCQPFSAAGKRKGRADERHLFPQMLRVISEVRPRWVVAENVRGLLSIESGSVFAEVITSLESEGYEVITFCVPASAVEAPHRRDRLWIVANNADVGRPSRPFSDQAGANNRERIFEKADRNAFNAERIGSERHAIPSTIENCDRPHDGLSESANSDAQNAFSERGGSKNGATTNEGRSTGTDWAESLRQGDGPKCPSRAIPAACNASQPSNPRTSRRKRVETDDARPGGRGSGLSGTSERVNGSGDASNAGVGGREDLLHGREPGWSSRERRNGGSQLNGWAESWIEAATRFCRMDDGVSDRTHRLKALGNSIVPQIALEIFKAIDEANGS